MVSLNGAASEEAAAGGGKGRSGGVHQYQLPDGSYVEVGPESFRAPEILFQPSIIGSEYRGALFAVAVSYFPVKHEGTLLRILTHFTAIKMFQEYQTVW